MIPIFNPGLRRWYCLRVPPQGERKAKQWLAARDVHSFYPVEERTRYRLGRQVKHERVYIPGYVFADFHGDPVWQSIIGEIVDDAQRFRPLVRLITGVICYAGTSIPAWLDPAALTKLQRMASTAEMIEDKRRRGMTLRKGDRVRIRDGVLEGSIVEIIDLKATTGVFHLPLLGLADQEIEIDRLEKVVATDLMCA